MNYTSFHKEQIEREENERQELSDKEYLNGMEEIGIKVLHG